MKKLLVKKLSMTLLVMAGLSPFVSAQTGTGFQKSADEIKADERDSMIIATMVDPQIATSSSNGESPDWESIRANVALKYDGTAADRVVTKKRIFYYWYKDWALFSTAIVHYTDAYENKDNLKVLNHNAKFILQYSQNSGEWKAAQKWAKRAMEKDPSNTAYKETYEALDAKIKG